MNLELWQVIEKYREQNGHNLEGSTGVANLCKLVRAIGYYDSMRRMQFGDGCLGDLVEFLQDNSGCIEAIINWIGEQEVQEWKEALESEIPLEECPHCGEEMAEDEDGVIGCSACGN